MEVSGASTVIFGSENISTYTRTSMTIWMVLAFQAGILNIGGFMACHSFVSHVTGFATLFGVALGEGSYAPALSLLLVPGCFLMGAMVSGVLVDLRLKLGKKPKYYIVFGVLFALILLVEIGGFNNFFGTFGVAVADSHDYWLLAALCLICGIQNGTVSLVSKSVVRTTHLTGVTTDLGIGLVRILNRARLKGKVDGEVEANWMRAGIILSFTWGGAIGYGVFHKWGFRGFLFPTLISGGLFFLTLYFQVLRKEVRA
jgi:uncharacterized membrane protein YoaK (UPF0700 family)